ncbi:transposable element Tcb1 transposase [Trichonephila clavipes]|nr:transposable element Tcb1 transposase [Trichonephila clavipes]
MVWGCMSSHGVGRLHIVSGTVKAMDYIEILQNKLLPTARDLLGNQSWIFQDDNAPCHRAKVVQKWLEDHTVNRMNWPGQSPDLNPIEFMGILLATVHKIALQKIKLGQSYCPSKGSVGSNYISNWNRHQRMSKTDKWLKYLLRKQVVDHQARRRFVEWAQNEIAVVPDFHKRILFSDEAHFWLNGYVNKQNGLIWSEANPQVYVETPLHPEKLTVWCALWAGGILLQKR